MNGAEALVKTAIKGGIEICFANPGTTEIPIVVALDRIKGVKAVLALFEGVCTGAADGYGRMSGKPAMTLLHLGPGFANGIANLHNARRAHAPIFNVIGEHASWHRQADPPLAMDIEGLAGTVSGWTLTNRAPSELPMDVAEAISAALKGQIASLIVPHDYQLAPCDSVLTEPSEKIYEPLNENKIKEAAFLLEDSKRTALLLGKEALSKEGISLAAEIRRFTGCDLLTETFPGRIERGSGLPVVARIPYFPEAAGEMLSEYEGVVLAGAKDPVTFFGYPGINGRILREDQEQVSLVTGNGDIIEALNLMIDVLKTNGAGWIRERDVVDHPGLFIPEGALTPDKACQTLAALQPEGAIIVEEGLTSSLNYYAFSASAPPHTILYVAGGAIGYGMPCAIGAALACPDRPVVSLQADGSAMYTVQSLWTQAREGLNTTTLICSNRSYKILKMELERAGIESLGISAQNLTDLTAPDINWVRIAEGFGVPGVAVSETKELSDALSHGLLERGPFLIEMVLEH